MIARQPDSLGRRRWLAFALVASTSAIVGIGFVFVGAWPILPWTGLEVIGLAIAFAVVGRRARDWERLVVRGDRVIVERSIRGRRERREFNRWWLKVDLEASDARREPHVTLRFAGEAMDFGNALPASERVEVVRTLRRLTASR